MLKTWMVAACLAMPLVAVGQTSQQNKMTACNKDAGDQKLTGDARKAFMSKCLSADGKPAAAANSKSMTQQEKMGYCNKEAGTKNLAGDDRKKFMSSCLSG